MVFIDDIGAARYTPLGDHNWCLYQKEDEIVVACRGTHDLYDVGTDVKLAVQGNTSSAWIPQWVKDVCPEWLMNLKGRDEEILGKLKPWLKEHTEVKHIVVTGHSLGGEVAARVTKLIKNDPELASMFKLAVYVNPGMSPYHQDDDWKTRLEDPKQKFLLSVGDLVWAGLIDFFDIEELHCDGGYLRRFRNFLKENTSLFAGEKIAQLDSQEKIRYGITFMTAGKSDNLDDNFEMNNGVPAIIQMHNLGCFFVKKNDPQSEIKHAIPRHNLKWYFRQEQIHLDKCLKDRTQLNTHHPVGSTEWVKDIICDQELKQRLLKELHHLTETEGLTYPWQSHFDTLQAQSDIDTLDDYYKTQNTCRKCSYVRESDHVDTCPECKTFEWGPDVSKRSMPRFASKNIHRAIGRRLVCRLYESEQRLSSESSRDVPSCSS